MVLEDTIEFDYSAFGTPLTFRTVRHNLHSITVSVEKRSFSYKCWSFLFFTITAVLLYNKYQNLSAGYHIAVIIALCVTIAAFVNLKVRRETLLAVSDLGLQLTTTFLSGRESTLFIDHNYIKHIVINEGITMQCVLYYLAAIVEHSNKDAVVPLFTATFPRFKVIRKVYGLLNEIL